ncbi:MAG: transglycosylase domain-containing protein [Deltaproteobacteria bacterium]|nr:transglycosylase domain-containing protein [Deltaproteobacteria bacterium]
MVAWKRRLLVETGTILLGLIALVFLGLLALYQHGLHLVGELPQPPRLEYGGLIAEALWNELEPGPMEVEPFWPWSPIVSLSRLASSQHRWQISPGGPSAQRVARLWVFKRAGLPQRGLDRVLAEACLSVWLTHHWSAAELTQARADGEYFGSGSDGLREASATLFLKRPEELALHEIALLVGRLQSPDRYSPYKHPRRVLERRNYVLKSLLARGLISAEECEAAARMPLDTFPPP